MSPKLKCDQNLNDTKTKMSQKLKCHQHKYKFIVTKTEMFKNYNNKKITDLVYI